MENIKFNCDCDRVIEMEDMGIRIEEILQYSRGVFSREDLLALIRGLEEIASTNGNDPEI